MLGVTFSLAAPLFCDQVTGLRVLADAAPFVVGRQLPHREYRDIVIDCMNRLSNVDVQVEGLRFLVELWGHDAQSRVPVGPHIQLLGKVLSG